jgi:[acyl-carrier-protein] S-malonyltransferase
MRPAAEQLAKDLQTLSFHAPVISVVNNVDVAIAGDAAAIQDALVRQLFSPVRWTETIEYLAAQGVTEVIELGAGKVLSGLIKRINKELVTTSVNDVVSLQAALAAKE